MSARLVYKDIAVGADEGANVTAPQAESFADTTELLNSTKAAPAIATLEANGWGLSHDYEVLNAQPIAFWSTARSGADCLFTAPPTISAQLAGVFTATGLTVRFAAGSMDFCKRVAVVWSLNGVTVASGEYIAESPTLVINRSVTAFDKISLTFNETNLPERRCKIDSIIIGVIREFEAAELKKLSVIQEVDLISKTVPSNVLDAHIHPNDDIEYIFQRKQPVDAYDGNTLIGVYYIETGKRTGLRDYSISCSDIIGLLEYITQDGGIWFEDTPLTDILTAIFGDTVRFDIDPAFANSTLRGYIEAGTTMRSALQQIAFALGAVVDTSGSDKVRLFPLPTGTAESIPAAKTYIGGSVNTSDVVTEVTVTAYIFFDERPEGSDEFIEHNGVKYRYYTDTKHAYNDTAVTTGTPEKVNKFLKMYLCNNSNAQTLADNIMEYYKRRNKYTFKHVLDDQTAAGHYTARLPWGEEDANGHITKMTITTSGLTVSSSEMLLDE